jgi:hypothetical protein
MYATVRAPAIRLPLMSRRNHRYIYAFLPVNYITCDFQNDLETVVAF